MFDAILNFKSIKNLIYNLSLNIIYNLFFLIIKPINILLKSIFVPPISSQKYDVINTKYSRNIAFFYKFILQKYQIQFRTNNWRFFPIFIMFTQLNNLQIHSFSAFKRPIQPQNYHTEYLAQLQAFIQQSINMKKKIQLIKCKNYQTTSNLLIHTLLDMICSIENQYNNQMKLSLPSNTLSSQGMTSISNGLITEIPISLFKNVCIMVQQSLFYIEDKYSCELILSMLFEKGLVETFKRCFLFPMLQGKQVPNNAYKINLIIIDEILNDLLKNSYKQTFLNNIYFLHSGNMISIQRTGFEQNLLCIITNIGKIFTQKTNLITRNLKNVKKSKFISEIVSHSVKTICNYKNEEFIIEQINKITNVLFGQQSKLSKEEFVKKMEGIFESSNNGGAVSVIHTLWLYIDLLRVEALMVNDPQLKINIIRQKEINSSNFYTQEMQKLLKKCPYNGDECCDCKKCQCVRRNRESAKLSQQKKRNAVQQLDPLKKRISQLERRNKQLQQQNKIFRSIVSELKNHENFKSDLQSTLQSISKVLND